MKMTLTKSKTFELEPFGHFIIKFVKYPDRVGARTIPACELETDNEGGMPFTKEQEKEFIKYLKKNKTDVLTDGSWNGYYTLTGSGLTRVHHKKLTDYRDDVGGFKAVIDGDNI